MFPGARNSAESIILANSFQDAHSRPAMKQVEDLATPCLLVDNARLEDNLVQMQAVADGARLRPHTKTHKMVALARRQRASGASGLTVAKVAEAEVFVRAGFKDVRVAYTVVGESALERLAKLSQMARVSFCVDTVEGAYLASAALSAAGVTLDVLIEIDVGHGRCGIRWDNPSLVALARKVHELPGLRLAGILTHEGHAYAVGQGAFRCAMEDARDRMLQVAARLSEADLAAPGHFEISMGSTPSMSVFENRSYGGFQITEIRPGNYVFNDMTQVALGVAPLSRCALTVLATVVSRHRRASGTEHFFVDAGRKVLTSDLAPGRSDYGCILYNPKARVAHPHARLTGLSEEHGWGRVRGGSTFEVGDRVQIVPNHACVVVNTQDHAYLVEQGEVVDTYGVDARGCVA